MVTPHRVMNRNSSFVAGKAEQEDAIQCVSGIVALAPRECRSARSSECGRFETGEAGKLPNLQFATFYFLEKVIDLKLALSSSILISR